MSNSKRGGRKQSERHLPRGNEYDGKHQEPQVGAVYEDSIKRVLNITRVHNDSIEGVVAHHNHQPDHDYSCSITTWRELWRDNTLAEATHAA